MSDSIGDQADGPSTPQEAIAHIEDQDWVLADLIKVFADIGVEFPITLMIGGVLISGNLMGGRAYFEEQSRLIASGASDHPQIQALLVRMIDQNKQLYDQPQDAGEDWSLPTPQFIHLRNARVFSTGGDPIPSNQGMLWRGKLSSVDGFWFGSLSASRH